MANEELKHYGVLGMRWGIRRDRKSSSKNVSRGKKKDSEEDKRENTTAQSKSSSSGSSKKKKVRDMSDDELIRAISRIELEKKYSSLNKKEVSRGKKIAKAVLYSAAVPAAKEIGIQVIKSALARSINDRTSFGDSEYKIYSNNQKKK